MNDAVVAWQEEREGFERLSGDPLDAEVYAITVVELNAEEKR